MPPERVLIRADAGDRIGHGHLGRCATLARELIRLGADVTLVVGERLGATEAIATRASSLEPLTVVTIPVPGGADDDVQAAGPVWRRADQERDAALSRAAVAGGGPDVVVIDHYRLDATWESAFRSAGARVLVIDDLADRRHDCDALVDMGVRDDPEQDYATLVDAGATRLFGPRYAVIDPAYAVAGARTEQERRQSGRARMVVAFGGSGSSQLSAAVLAAADCDRLRDLDVEVVVPRPLRLDDPLAVALSQRSDVVVHQSPDGLTAILSGADLAVGAGGVTTWERLAAGVPSIVITTASNQEPSTQRLASDGLLLHLGSAEDVDPMRLRDAIIRLVEDASQRARMRAAGCALVDADGARRVAIAALETSTGVTRLRPASPSDALALLGLTNDPEVRRQSFTGRPVALDDHLAWFDQQLEDPRRALFVLEVGAVIVGQIRFSPADDGLELSYSLDAAVRGRGLAAGLISEGCRQVRAHGESGIIVARTRSQNAASRRALVRAGFGLHDTSDPDRVTYWHDGTEPAGRSEQP